MRQLLFLLRSFTFIHVCLSRFRLVVKGLVQTATNLSRGQDDGGELRAVAPLCQEGEGEGLDEDGRDKAVPLLLRDGRPCSSLHVRSSVHLFGSLELQRRRSISTARKVLNVSTLKQRTKTCHFSPPCTCSANNHSVKSASEDKVHRRSHAYQIGITKIIVIYDNRLVPPPLSLMMKNGLESFQKAM